MLCKSTRISESRSREEWVCSKKLAPRAEGQERVPHEYQCRSCGDTVKLNAPLLEYRMLCIFCWCKEGYGTTEAKRRDKGTVHR